LDNDINGCIDRCVDHDRKAQGVDRINILWIC
jgi:hypothetical protein